MLIDPSSKGAFAARDLIDRKMPKPRRMGELPGGGTPQPLLSEAGEKLLIEALLTNKRLEGTTVEVKDITPDDD